VPAAIRAASEDLPAPATPPTIRRVGVWEMAVTPVLDHRDGHGKEFSWETSTFVVNAQHVSRTASTFRQFS